MLALAGFVVLTVTVSGALVGRGLYGLAAGVRALDGTGCCGQLQ